jgi:hypothetical protein
LLTPTIGRIEIPEFAEGRPFGTLAIAGDSRSMFDVAAGSACTADSTTRKLSRRPQSARFARLWGFWFEDLVVGT